MSLETASLKPLSEDVYPSVQNRLISMVAGTGMGIGEMLSAMNAVYPAVGELRVLAVEMLETLLSHRDRYMNYDSEIIRAVREDNIYLNRLGKSIMSLIANLTESGLVTPEELGKIIIGKPVAQIDPAPKYVTWEELVKIRDEMGEDWTGGIVHGGLYPVHWGHLRLIKETALQSTDMIVGFDPRWDLKRRKPRARLESHHIPLAAAMREAARTPYVNYVVVLPLIETTEQDRDEEMMRIYRRLGIRALGVGPDNPLRDKFADRMRQLNGWLVEDRLFRVTSATGIMEEYTWFKEMGIYKELIEHFGGYMQYADNIARQEGFLRDYPDLTERRNVRAIRRRLRHTNTI